MGSAKVKLKIRGFWVGVQSTLYLTSFTQCNV
jgi:hypothetical protein